MTDRTRSDAPSRTWGARLCRVGGWFLLILTVLFVVTWTWGMVIQPPSWPSHPTDRPTMTVELVGGPRTGCGRGAWIWQARDQDGAPVEVCDHRGYRASSLELGDRVAVGPPRTVHRFGNASGAVALGIIPVLLLVGGAKALLRRGRRAGTDHHEQMPGDGDPDGDPDHATWIDAWLDEDSGSDP